MKQASLFLRGAALACALGAASVPALAQHASKHASAPARWSTGDSTKQQRTAILKKEINAAYAQQQSECRHGSASHRSACLKSARQTYQHDMANVPRLVANPPVSEVLERVVSVTPVTPAAPTQPGSTAYGSSGAGATGSSSGTDAGATGAGSGQNGQYGEGGNLQQQQLPPDLRPQQAQPQQQPDSMPAQQQ